MDSKKYIFHTDPGHGWLEVERAELVHLNLLDQITPYSYQNGEKVYLEEDCDASTFIRAKEARGESFENVEQYKEHTPIRRYQSFSA